MVHKSAFAVSICVFKSLDMEYGYYAIENSVARKIWWLMAWIKKWITSIPFPYKCRRCLGRLHIL